MTYISPPPLARRDLSTRRGVFAALSVEPMSAARGTVLLLPGYTKDKEDFLPLLPLLSEAGYRAFAVDLRGQNETEGGHDATAYRREELGEDVVALAEALGARPHLAGHSMGGQIARGAVLAAPSAFASLTLLSSGPAQVGEERGAQVKLLTGALTTMTMDQVWPSLQRLRPERASSPGADERRARWLRTNRTQLLATGRNLLDEPDRTAELAALSGLAVHVLHGDRDDTWAPPVLADMARRLGARHTALADTGHSPHVERPQAAARAMASFWDGVRSTASPR
ncbi:alpha/beta fold hydrolase [Streptomyces sp. NPDC005921]|uniref:alpha/beta fold hydrolase n=1 Tax=Streptomyces sp. NPDC005827 TaxID=3157070 RepID=UPI0033BFEA6C